MLRYRTGVTFQTPCTTALTTGVWKRIRLSGKKFLEGKASFYIAIEVHPTSPTGYTDDFKAAVMPALQNDVNRLVDVTVRVILKLLLVLLSTMLWMVCLLLISLLLFLLDRN